MKNFIKAPLSNLVAIICVLLIAFSLLTAGGSVGGELVPLSLGGTTSNITGSLAVSSNLTVNGTTTLATGEIGATEIADVTRAISFPLFSFVECTTNAATALKFTDGTDALPNFNNSSTDGLGGTIRFDDTGSSEDETTKICNSFMVPSDYASGGTFRVRALKDGATATNSEDINCAVSVNGAALEAAGTISVSVAATGSYICTPTIAALAVNDSVSYNLTITSETGAGLMDDTVDIASVEFVYTSTQ